MDSTRAARLARVKFVALPLPGPAPVAAPAPARGVFAALLRPLLRVFGCLEAARP